MKKAFKSICSRLLKRTLARSDVSEGMSVAVNVAISPSSPQSDVVALRSYADKIANDSLSYLNFNGERIDRLKYDIWEGNQQLLSRFYLERTVKSIKIVFFGGGHFFIGCVSSDLLTIS